MPTFHTSLAKSEASHQLFQIGESLFFHVWCHVSVVFSWLFSSMHEAGLAAAQADILSLLDFMYIFQVFSMKREGLIGFDVLISVEKTVSG